MSVNVLISTIDQGIERVISVLQPRLPDVKYIISHQYRDEKHKTIPIALNRSDVIVSQILGKGLSRNRNNALQQADGDIAIIADDDVTYLPDSFKTIEEVFKNDPELDVACFKIKTPDDSPEYKEYPEQTYNLKKKWRHYVSSIEVAFRINRVKEKGIIFDERFGIGNDLLPGGEETIFIYDCIRHGLKTVYEPHFIVEHPLDNAVRKLPAYDTTRAKVSAAIDAYCNPVMAIPIAFGRTLKYSPAMFRNKRNPLKHLLSGLRAILYIYFSKKK